METVILAGEPPAKIPAVIFVGKFLFLPSNSGSLVTVVGEPLDLPRIPHPTKENVEFWHKQYTQCLVDTFDKHKGKYAHEGESAQLEII